MLHKEKQNKLPITEDLDFHYLLSLMPPLSDVDEFQWLPELFTIIGYEKLIELCKYAGGEVIKIPELDELSKAIEALQWFYNIEIKQISSISEVPKRILPTLTKIIEVYDARNSE